LLASRCPLDASGALPVEYGAMVLQAEERQVSLGPIRWIVIQVRNLTELNIEILTNVSDTATVARDGLDIRWQTQSR
jgi:hypothetical protein